MRVGIDARELVGRPTGVGRYLEGLLGEWAARDDLPRHEFVLYAHMPLNKGLDNRRFLTRTVAGHGGTVWEQVQLPAAVRRDHLDVFFSPGYTAPLLIGIPSVVAIHDISFVAHPEWFMAREGLRRRLMTRRAAEHASAVIAISEFSRRELIERLGIRPEHIHVVPPGVTRFGTLATDGPGGEPRLLFVGSIFNRRHVPDLVRSFGLVARARPFATLDIVGDNRTHPHEDIGQVIATEGLTGRVQWRQYVSDDDLRTLYASSRAFAFLSEYEGLGLTPLEALAAGLPPVLLDTPVAHESCGAAALYVAPGDRSGTARAIEAVLFDDDLRRRLLAAAPTVLSRYEWPQAANRTLAVLEQAASAPSPRMERW